MPGLVEQPVESRKRKRALVGLIRSSKKLRQDVQEGGGENAQEAQIIFLEQQIVTSKRHFNSIVTLIGYARGHHPKTNTLAIVALCRIFCRSIAAGNLTKTRDTTEQDTVIMKWLHSKLQEYQDILLMYLADHDTAKQSVALTLLMRLFREQSAHLKLGKNAIWGDGVFQNILRVLLETRQAEEARMQFVEQYAKEYEDIRYYTFCTLG